MRDNRSTLAADSETQGGGGAYCGQGEIGAVGDPRGVCDDAQNANRSRASWSKSPRTIDVIFAPANDARVDAPIAMNAIETASAISAASEWLRYSLDPHVREIGARLERWVQGDCVESLASALGITEAGGPSVRQAIRLELRNALIRALRRNHFADKTDAAASKSIEAGWKDYAARAWLRDRANELGPIDEPRRSFWSLMRHDHSPLGWRQILRVLARD